MGFLYRAEDLVLGWFARLLDHSILSTLARLIFAGTLFIWLWNSAKTKVYSSRDGFSFFPRDGAFYSMFPKQIEAAGGDVSQLGGIYQIIAFIGAYGEIILPILIIIGLFTRTAAFGMVIFIAVLTFVDVTGHQISKVHDDALAKAKTDLAAFNEKAEPIEAVGKVPFSVRQYVRADPPVGTWFDGKEDSKIADVRPYWIFLLLFLVARGGGPLSLDRLLRRQKPEIDYD